MAEELKIKEKEKVEINPKVNSERLNALILIGLPFFIFPIAVW